MRYFLRGNKLRYKSEVAKLAVKVGAIAYAAGVAIDMLYGHSFIQSLINPQNVGGAIGIASFAVICGSTLPYYKKWKARRHKEPLCGDQLNVSVRPSKVNQDVPLPKDYLISVEWNGLQSESTPPA
jgi:hypothetical protein